MAWQLPFKRKSEVNNNRKNKQGSQLTGEQLSRKLFYKDCISKSMIQL